MKRCFPFVFSVKAWRNGDRLVVEKPKKYNDGKCISCLTQINYYPITRKILSK